MTTLTLCPCSGWLSKHMVNYFTFEKINNKDKSNKIFHLIFKKMCVRVVVDYADTCWNSRWLRGHHISVVIKYMDTVSAKLLTMWTQCQRIQRLHRHGNDYVVTFRKLWMKASHRFERKNQVKKNLDLCKYPIAII